MERDHKKEDFVKINPQHKIPTIIDDGFILSESRAISVYLCEKFGGEKLYPKDLQKRAFIDRLLFFDCGTLYPSIYHYFTTQARKNISEEYAEYVLDRLHDSLKVLNEFLKTGPFLIGENYTLADFSLISIMALLPEMKSVDFSPYPNITAWINRLKTALPWYDEINEAKVSFAKLVAYHKSFNDPKYNTK